ncbi:DUF1722 domain-containing protein [Gracilibacillus massiliensis]|uniref:DUF1722 domain-containing protein n=1 Tax=Gracilibacillus massiliensis TaxID=1564956 RepID=UPI00071DB114|nr:YbgA family protein [Gracilibacillus massiliensis]
MELKIYETYKHIVLVELDSLKKDGSVKALIAFQTRHKYLLMAFHPSNQKSIGRIIANHRNRERDQLLHKIEDLLEETIEVAPSDGSVINALSHMFGYFRGQLTSIEKEKFLLLLEDFRHGQTRLQEILLTMLEWAQLYNEHYILNQSILDLVRHK